MCYCCGWTRYKPNADDEVSLICADGGESGFTLTVVPENPTVIINVIWYSVDGGILTLEQTGGTSYVSFLDSADFLILVVTSKGTTFINVSTPCESSFLDGWITPDNELWDWGI